MNRFCQLYLLLLFPLYAFSQSVVLPIDQDWQFRQAGTENWLPATVPGTVHTDLLANKKISDPYYRTNEQDQQWIERKDWEYQTHFSASSELITKDKIFLFFHGLDTYADVYLNDSLICKANNMFRSWQVPVDGVLNTGDNTLRIYFHSPISTTEPLYDSLGYIIPVSPNDQAEKKLSVFSRKAPYHFGWDWGPRFVTSGIWRSVELVAWSTAQISKAQIIQKSITDEKAEMLANISCLVTRPFIGQMQILVNDQIVKSSAVDMAIGTQENTLTFSIDNPERWWPNGMGSQKLYHVTIRLLKDAQIIDTSSTKTGLRTIELVQQKDRSGKSFYFKVNGKPFFAKGANYIPQDNFLTRVTPDRYEHILQSAADAHMNMIRVWGGGIYENELFYDLCDEKGLLVWQDFMFACAMYPGDSAFLENVRAEANENVARLSSHPCMALWCGNNEIVVFWNNWKHNGKGRDDQAPFWTDSKDSLKLVHAYRDIFKDILPNAVKAHGQGVPYWESSPSSDKHEVPDLKTGDEHYWMVWWGQKPFESYRTNIGRFMSEYGFQSFPEWKTVSYFTDSSDWDIYSDVMKAHQRSSIGNKTIANYLQRHFQEPVDFKQYLYLSQLLQAEGIKVAMEAHRIAKPYNMGTLVWQLDDCWPVASWSSIDYFGRWKALHYYIKRAFGDILLAFDTQDGVLNLHGVSDIEKETKGTLKVDLIDLNGKTISLEEKKARIKPGASSVIWHTNISDLLRKRQKENLIVRARFITEGKVIAGNQYLFVPHKDLKLGVPKFKYEFQKKADGLYLSVKSDKTALGVCIDPDELDAWFSDNYFTLFAGETKTVKIKTNAPDYEIKNKLTVQSLADSYLR